MRLLAAALLVLGCPLLVFVSAGCGVSSPSSNKTDTFSATLSVGGYNSHPFTSGGSGEFAVKLPSVTPDPNAILELGFGQMSGSTCLAFGIYVAPARANNPATPLSGPIQKGNYCIAVYDSGFLMQPATYTVTVSHP